MLIRKEKKRMAKISEIAKNWSSVASNATDLIPVKKLLMSLMNAIGKSKKKP